MKNSELARRLLGAACLVTVAACASVPSPSPSAAPALAADASVTPDPARAQALRMQADTLERNAEQRFLHEEAGCYDRFLVNRCLDQARERRLADVREARALNIEARRIERAVNLAELEALNAQRAADGRPPLGDGFEPGEPFDSVPAPSADVTTKIPPVPAKTDIPIPPDDPAAVRLRAQREAALREAERAEAAVEAQRDAAAATRRSEEAAAAAVRAEEAEQRRARYDQRIRERELERAAEAEKAGQPATTP